MNTPWHPSRSWWLAAGIALAIVLWMLSGALGKPGELPVAEPQSGDDESRPWIVRARRSVAEPMTTALMLTGRTVAERRVAVKAETAGLIAEVLVARGAMVEQGQSILRFATEEREARLKEARATLAAARSRYEATRSLKQQGFQAVLELGRAKAELNAAEAGVQMATLELQRIDVRAPFAGVVNERFVEAGDFVDRGQPLALIVDLDPMRVAAQVSERYLGQIRQDTPGEVHTLDGQRYAGRVSYLGRIADPATRTIPVELQVPNPDGGLIEGITAQIALPVEQVFAHRVAPSVLSLADDGTLGLKSVDETGRVRFHPVKVLGDSAEALWLGGLPAELNLITVGQAFVVPGQRVEVVAEGAAP